MQPERRSLVANASAEGSLAKVWSASAETFAGLPPPRHHVGSRVSPQVFAYGMFLISFAFRFRLVHVQLQ